MLHLAHIIPCRKTPHDKEVFDYAIPPEMIVKPGDLVLIPFQQSTIIGLVDKIIHTDQQPIHTIKSVIKPLQDLHFPEKLTQFLDDLARHTFYPRSGMLKSWLRTIPKKILKKTSEEATPLKNREETHETQAIWTHGPFQDLLKTIEQSLKEKKRTLILVPWKHQLTKLAAYFPKIIYLDSKTTDTEYANAWISWIQNEPICIASTRLGAWLAPLADHCILYEPENEDHKQDELQPRFDTRWIARWCANQHHQVTSIGITPPLHNQTQTAPTIPVNLHIIETTVQGKSVIPCIQPTTLELIEAYHGTITIIHPIKGKQGSITCWDCGWRLICSHCQSRTRLLQNHAECSYCHRKQEIPLNCPQCQGLRLNKGLPGIEQLKTAWKKAQFKPIQWRTTDNESLSQSFERESLIVLTMPELLSGHGEDIRNKERFIIRFRHLAAEICEARSTLVIQTKEANDTKQPLQNLLTQEGFDAWRTQELQNRETFHYPPYKKLIKILFDLSAVDTRDLINSWQKNISSNWIIKGPYQIEMNSKSKRMRQVIQLIVPKETVEKDLIKALNPLKRHGIIDLDPVAFFR